MCERFREYLKWWPDCGYTERTVLVTSLAQDSYLVKQSASWLNLRSNRPARRFFRLQAADYAQKKRISRGSFDLFVTNVSIWLPWERFSAPLTPLVTFRHQKRSRFLRAFGTVSMEAGGQSWTECYSSEYFLLRKYTLSTVTINPTPCKNVNCSSKNNHDKNNATSGIKYNIIPAKWTGSQRKEFK